MKYKVRYSAFVIVKAQVEVSALQREAVAYYDGAYDATKHVKQLLVEHGRTTES